MLRDHLEKEYRQINHQIIKSYMTPTLAGSLVLCPYLVARSIPQIHHLNHPCTISRLRPSNLGKETLRFGSSNTCYICPELLIQHNIVA